jgi:hypothetical protein
MSAFFCWSTAQPCGVIAATRHERRFDADEVVYECTKRAKQAVEPGPSCACGSLENCIHPRGGLKWHIQ